MNRLAQPPSTLVILSAAKDLLCFSQISGLGRVASGLRGFSPSRQISHTLVILSAAKNLLLEVSGRCRQMHVENAR
jgi:hypothetical protein